MSPSFLSTSSAANLYHNRQLRAAFTHNLLLLLYVSPLLEQSIFLGCKLQLDVPLLIMLQNVFIGHPLRGPLVGVVREPVLQRPPTPEVELVALHISACARTPDTQDADTIIHVFDNSLPGLCSNFALTSRSRPAKGVP